MCFTINSLICVTYSAANIEFKVATCNSGGHRQRNCEYLQLYPTLPAYILTCYLVCTYLDKYCILDILNDFLSSSSFC